jgi:hypothetical protein
MSRGAAFEATTVVATAMVPATAMVATGHTWIAAGTIGAMLGSLLLLARIRTRAATEQHRETLSYAHTATSMGADAAEVIKALHADDELWHREDSGGFDVPAGVHLPPRHR